MKVNRYRQGNSVKLDKHGCCLIEDPEGNPVAYGGPSSIPLSEAPDPNRPKLYVKEVDHESNIVVLMSTEDASSLES